MCVQWPASIFGPRLRARTEIPALNSARMDLAAFEQWLDGHTGTTGTRVVAY
jgi:hypothetical protein